MSKDIIRLLYKFWLKYHLNML